MRSLLIDCGRCNAKGAAFVLKAEHKHPRNSYRWYCLGVCGICNHTSLLLVDCNSSGNGPVSEESVGISAVSEALPKPDEPRIASDISDQVRVPLREAENAFSAGLFSVAASCYRKSMERATKEIDPDATGMLNARIRKIERDGQLPSAMIDLLDQVRLFGNEAMHEDDIDPTQEDCVAAREFAHLFLTYAFSLPAKIARAQGTAGNADPST